MKKSNTSLGESLVFEGLLTQEQFNQVQAEVKQTHESFSRVLKRFQLIDEKRLMKFMSAKFRIPQVELTHQIIKPQILKLIPELLVRKLGVMPIRKVGRRLTVALTDPLNLNVMDRLRLESGFDIDPALATDSEIKSAIDQYYGARSEMSDVVQTLTAPDEMPTENFEVGEGMKAEEAPVMKLVNTMIAEAVKQGASDIHIAPDKHEVLVRYRVDGVLREADRYPKASHNSVVSRMKVMTSLDISENRIPQDGRVQINRNGAQVDLRVSIVPTIQGENIVIRLLNLGTAVRTLEGLGMSHVDLEVFQNLIEKPHGILLITGPTGSGKTTTLYAALHQINTPDKNIVTIEDPVEYQLPMVRQIHVNPKVDLTFARGLRSILRQDPDVIMVGEIRDKETAEIAIQAALTGHFVFSTLHTNDSTSAVTRLVDMGIEPFLISSTVIGVVAQRLVRTICLECRSEFPADERSLTKLNLVDAGAPTKGNYQLSKLFRGAGCLSCKKTGFKGRSGIFEIFTIEDESRELILNKASNLTVRDRAILKGMRTLRRDGLEKIKNGTTTVEEVLKATQNV
jgi:type IV pilus assembly protein PilB